MPSQTPGLWRSSAKFTLVNMCSNFVSVWAP